MYEDAVGSLQKAIHFRPSLARKYQYFLVDNKTIRLCKYTHTHTIYYFMNVVHESTESIFDVQTIVHLK